MIHTLMDVIPFRTIMGILPELPKNINTPADALKDNIAFFATWISRIGCMIAFIGATKLAISVKSDDSKEQFNAAMTMAAGFMIAIAVGSMDMFNIPATYSAKAAETEFQSIVKFIGKWAARAGGIVTFLGLASLMLSIKDENAGGKVTATRTITTGASIIGIAASIHLFV